MNGLYVRGFKSAQLQFKLPLQVRGFKNNPVVSHACRKRQLKWSRGEGNGKPTHHNTIPLINGSQNKTNGPQSPAALKWAEGAKNPGVSKGPCHYRNCRS